MELPEIELSHEKKGDENVVTGKSTGKAGKLVETGAAPYKVTDEEDQWRYPKDLLQEAIKAGGSASSSSSTSGAGGKKSIKAAIQKRKEAAAQQSAGGRAGGRGAGPSAQAGGRHKPTSKPKATSC